MTSYNDASPSKSRTSSSTVASASVRPRNKRLITGLEDFVEGTESSTNNPAALTSPSASYFESPFNSRAPSPIPSKHPSRSSSLRPSASRTALAGNGLAISPTNDLAASLSGIWGKSWTSLQGLASNVLGSDLTDPIKDNPNGPRKPRAAASARRDTASRKWGPPELTQPGAGSREERNALVRAKQRRELLMQVGQGESYFSNPAAHYKRRTSDDFESASAPPSQMDNREALVYIHLVAPHDTLPGISIKFNCPMATIKKSNGMWSNDGIQARKQLIIPVDACNVKGKRVVGPEKKSEDLLSDNSQNDADATPTQASVDWANDIRRGSTSTIKPTTSAANNGVEEVKSADENPWTHESWILIDGHQNAIEIARLPRQHLGFFPRARRKSNAQSDVDGPSASLEQSRSSLTISDSSSIGPRTYHKPRRSSGSQDFGKHMIGPGGVGPLKGKGPSAPGPAEDKLNKVFSKPLLLPSIVVPRRPSLDEEVSLSEHSSPGASLDNIGTAIQGWVSKLAKSASKAMEPPPPPSSSSYAYARHIRENRQQRVTQDVRTTASGDLIELANAFEIGEDEEDGTVADYIERGRDRTPTNGRS